MKLATISLTLTLASLAIPSLGHSGLSPAKRAPVKKDSRVVLSRRKLAAKVGTNCLSSASVTCTQGSMASFLDQSKPNIPCNDTFLAIKESQCENNAAVTQKVVIQWKYCNLDSLAAVPRAAKTTGMYKGTFNNQVSSGEQLQPGECRTYSDEKEIDLCAEGGLAAEMKYEAFLPSKPEAYCYAYDFLRFRRTWLPEEECSVSAKVSCELNGGENPGAQCDGNLFRRLERDDTPICDEVPVTFTFEHCLRNTTVGTFVYENQDDDELTKIKVNNTLYSVEDKSNFPSTAEGSCRIQTIDSVVNTCATRAAARLYVHGHINGNRDANCSAFDFYQSSPVIVTSPPTSTPSQEPSFAPSAIPTLEPSLNPTSTPSFSPTIIGDTLPPTPSPTRAVDPGTLTNAPTSSPTTSPPTSHPTCWRRLRGTKV